MSDQPEFSRPIAIDQLGPGETEYSIEANEAERTALAARFGILGIDQFSASLRLRPLAEGMVRLSGHLEADVRQACVITLVEVPARIAERFERTFAEGDLDERPDVTVDFDDEPPDPLIDGMIDIGEVAAEQLALALDPYPRTPGAEFVAAETSDSVGPSNPFAKLEALKKPKA